jgi:hypothetical protein
LKSANQRQQDSSNSNSKNDRRNQQQRGGRQEASPSSLYDVPEAAPPTSYEPAETIVEYETEPLATYASESNDIADSGTDVGYDDYDPTDIPEDQAKPAVDYVYEEAPLPTYAAEVAPAPAYGSPSEETEVIADEYPDDYDDYDPNDVPADQAGPNSIYNAPETTPFLPTPTPSVQGGYNDPDSDLLPEYFKSEITLGLNDPNDIPQIDPYSSNSVSDSYSADASTNVETYQEPDLSYGVPAAPAISLSDYNVPQVSDQGYTGLSGSSYGK